VAKQNFLCINTTFSWFIHQLWGILAVSIAGLLWIVCNKHGCAGAFVITWVIFLQVYP
jgi:hypothetical protein